MASWGEIANKRHWKELTSAQRSVLITVTRAYKTAPTEVLPVIAGVIHIQLESKRRILNYKIRTGQRLIIRGVTYESPKLRNDASESEIRNLKLRRSKLRKMVYETTIEEWQTEWDLSERQTKLYFRNIKDRLKMRWLDIDHYTCQFLTGHGDFAEKLNGMKLKPSPYCECGDLETSEHTLKYCQILSQERLILIDEMQQKQILWPPQERELVQKDVYERLQEFAANVIKKKNNR